MQCSKCGKQLEENSKFCQYCGSPVVNAPEQSSMSNNSSESEGWFVKIKKQYNFNNKQVGVYLIWLFIHTLLWLFSDSSSRDTKYFWPFHNEHSCYYDFTEFFVYTVTPIVFVVVRKLFKNK